MFSFRKINFPTHCSTSHDASDRSRKDGSSADDLSFAGNPALLGVLVFCPSLHTPHTPSYANLAVLSPTKKLERQHAFLHYLVMESSLEETSYVWKT